MLRRSDDNDNGNGAGAGVGGGGAGQTGDGDGEGNGMGDGDGGQAGGAGEGDGDGNGVANPESEEEKEEKYEEEKGEPCQDVDVDGLTGTCNGNAFNLKCITPKDEQPYFTHEFEEDEKDGAGDQDYFYYLSFTGLPEESFGQCKSLGDDEKAGNAVVQASKNGHHCYVLGPKSSATWSYNDETEGLQFLVVTYQTAEKFVEVHIYCDENADEPMYSVRGEEEEWENHYDLELRSKWVCKEFAGKACDADTDGGHESDDEKTEKEKEEEEKYEEEKGAKCTGIDANALTGTCKGIEFDLSCIVPKDEQLYFSREFEEDEKDGAGDQDYFYYLSFTGLPEESFGQCSLGDDEKAGNAVVQASKNGHHCYVLGKQASPEWYFNDDVPQHELLVVSYKTGEKFVEVHIFCDEEADEPNYSVRGEEEEWENHYDLELRSKWVCKKFAGTKKCSTADTAPSKKGGLVFGVLALLAVASVGAVYVVRRRRSTGGSAFNAYNNAPDFDLNLLDPDDDMVVFSQGESHNSNRSLNGDHIDGILEA